jgi:serine/threonine-protein kinase
VAALIFNKYEKIRRLAQGGMGEVYLARQRGLVGFDRLVILKALREDLADEKDFVDQFLDEARVAATLNHPNIVALYEVDIWEGTYFMAMEYINGEDLSRLWYAAAKAGVGLPFQVSVRIIHDAAVGLDYAHHAMDVTGQALNIVHRDVSPQNIMVRADGVTKVVDFGIAKASNRITKTQAGTVKGKLQYMSPEQVRGEHLDGRSDQFSLGTVLWEMCTGKRLFKADSELETLNKILQHPIPRPGQIVDSFPPELEHCIMKMLERDRERRYPRLKDAARELKAYIDKAAAAAGEQGVAEFVQEILGEELRARTADLTPEEDDSSAGVSTVDNVPRPGAINIYMHRNGQQMQLANREALSQAILEARVRAEDQMTEDGGQTWRKVSDVPELQKFLSVAVAIDTMERSAKREAVPAPAAARPPPADPSDDFQVNTQQSLDAYPGNEATEVAPSGLDSSDIPTMSGEEGPVFASSDEQGAVIPPRTGGVAETEVAADAGPMPLPQRPQPTPATPATPSVPPQPQVAPNYSQPHVAPNYSQPQVAPDYSQPYVANASNGYSQPYVAPSPQVSASDGPSLGDLNQVPETGQWSLGSVPAGQSQADNYSFPPSLSNEIALETSGQVSAPKRSSGARRLVVFMMLGAAVAVAGGFAVVLTKPELIQPYVQRFKAGPAPPAALDEAPVVAALQSLDEAKQIALADTLAGKGPKHDAAASMLWTEVARSRAERARLAGLDGAELQKARGKAYRLATKAQGEGAGPLARLSMGAYQAEQLGLVEMKADLDAAEGELKGSPWEAEATRVRMLAQLTKGLRADSITDETRAQAVKAAGVSTKDRRLAYLALLARSEESNEKWSSDVERFFGASHTKWRDGVLKVGGLEPPEGEPAPTPDEPKPDETPPVEAKPDEVKPEETPPVEANPDEVKPDEAKPDEAKPEEAKPEEAKPEEAKPEVSYEKLVARANSAQKRGRSSAAIVLYRKALKVKPEQAEPYVGIGWAYVDAGNNKRARAAFGKALKIEPERAGAALGLAEALRYDGEEQKALRYYKRYLSLAPSGPDAQIARNAISAIEANQGGGG